ncbi:MAG: dihydrofolate reductase [Marinilabilia sp.]
MNLSIIVATDQNNGIGAGGDQPFYISADLKRFKNLTTGHTIVMGRRTYEALPKGALPNRRNIVLSHREDYEAPGCEIMTHPSQLGKMCGPEEKVFVIGGGEIFRLLLPLANQIYLTRIHHSFNNIDTWFPEINPSEWMTDPPEGPFTDSKTGLIYTYINYRRKNQSTSHAQR